MTTSPRPRPVAAEVHRSLFEQSPNGLLEIAPDGQVVAANRRMAELLHASPDALRDATDEVTARAALAESERRHGRLFQASGAGIAIANLDGTYVDANASLCSMLGYSVAAWPTGPPSTSPSNWTRHGAPTCRSASSARQSATTQATSCVPMGRCRT